MAVQTATTLGDRLKMFREAAGLTQGELSRRSGIPQGNISKIESNRISDVKISTLRMLADGLGIGIAELVEDVPNGNSASEEVYRALRRCGLDDEQMEIVGFILHKSNPNIPLLSAVAASAS